MPSVGREIKTYDLLDAADDVADGGEVAGDVRADKGVIGTVNTDVEVEEDADQTCTYGGVELFMMELFMRSPEGLALKNDVLVS